MITKTKGNIHKPIHKFSHASFNSSINLTKTTIIIQALKISAWHRAMSNEFNCLMNNHRLNLLPSHASQNLVGCKWCFILNGFLMGPLTSTKQAKGVHQWLDINYYDTVSPIIKPTTIRLKPGIGLSCGCPRHQLGVNNVFFHDYLK